MLFICNVLFLWLENCLFVVVRYVFNYCYFLFVRIFNLLILNKSFLVGRIFYVVLEVELVSIFGYRVFGCLLYGERIFVVFVVFDFDIYG